MTFDQWSAGATCGWAGCLSRFCSGPCRDQHRARCPWRTGVRAEKQQPVTSTSSDVLAGDLDWYAQYCAAVRVGCDASVVTSASLDGLDAVVERFALADESRRGLYSLVARNLRWRFEVVGRWDGFVQEVLPADLRPLHMPAVREALGALVPEALHPSLDKVVAKGKDAFGPVRGVSQLVLDCWGVSVRTEDALARGALQVDALEFFLKLMARFSMRFEWPVLVGSFTVGKAVGRCEALDDFARVFQSWRSVWSRGLLVGKKELVLPVAVDERCRDWLCVHVRCVEDSETLDSGKRLRVVVRDSFARGTLAKRIARNIDALLRPIASVVGADQPVIEHVKAVAPGVASQRILDALGAVVRRVLEVGGKPFIDSAEGVFLVDFARVLRSIFARVFEEVGARGLRDAADLFDDDDFVSELLSMFSVVPSLVARASPCHGVGVPRVQVSSVDSRTGSLELTGVLRVAT